jgi:hypothetical protein
MALEEAGYAESTGLRIAAEGGASLAIAPLDLGAGVMSESPEEEGPME